MTEEIAQQISAIQTATGESVGAIEEIAATIVSVNDIATTIATAVEEQGAATKEIARNVQETARGTQEVSANVAGVSATAAATGRMAEKVLAAAGDLGRQSAVLREEVERFFASIRAA